ncbi:MAG: hypothetical protein ABI461_03170, partial [Polyangiaceae bacterium]
GALPSLLVNRYLFGSAFAVPQGRYFLFFAHAHPWLVLFAPRGGLFYSAPTAWLGVIGCGMALGNRRWRVFFGALLLGAALEIYIASSALDWHESGGFGARRLATITPLLVAGAAVLLESLRRWFSRRRARAQIALGIGVLASMTVFTFGLVDASAHNAIVPDFGHSQADYYGASDRWSGVCSTRKSAIWLFYRPKSYFPFAIICRPAAFATPPSRLHTRVCSAVTCISPPTTFRSTTRA